MKSFGVKKQRVNKDLYDFFKEELEIKGFTIIKNVLNSKQIDFYRKKIDELYLIQINEVGIDNLKKINELDLVRLPLAYDLSFLDLIFNKEIVNLMDFLLGEYYIVNLQNAIINRPGVGHHQNSWHRDLPYQDFVSSIPLALNVMFCIDPFNSLTGGTILLPHSHKLDVMPSVEFISKNQYQVNLDEGDVIIFDSMIFHSAGYNSSDLVRRGVNNMYSLPFLKQQFDIPNMIDNNLITDLKQMKILGIENKLFNSIKKWREFKIKLKK